MNKRLLIGVLALALVFGTTAYVTYAHGVNYAGKGLNDNYSFIQSQNFGNGFMGQQSFNWGDMYRYMGQQFDGEVDLDQMYQFMGQFGVDIEQMFNFMDQLGVEIDDMLEIMNSGMDFEEMWNYMEDYDLDYNQMGNFMQGQNINFNQMGQYMQQYNPDLDEDDFQDFYNSMYRGSSRGFNYGGMMNY
ncbi:hypothetical protein BHF71_00195 [Vulcanibacillus modesticaldus]|uniref:Uncharacterized protein n=1 Tax=Vulcanibacillus modesticaldus TaxID=337097 RepID=A0A1D2YXE2_9BACI|nr:hypothetical protein [Vulcanibacillus modesticaldus]OEG00364.1 hypothetical protein BHF71_00195 [Vulcanibacillus modesticaldus]